MISFRVYLAWSNNRPQFKSVATFVLVLCHEGKLVIINVLRFKLLFLQELHKYDGRDWGEEEASKGKGPPVDASQHDGDLAPAGMETT